MKADRTLLNSFWHRTRKEFVPLTREEFIRRSGISSRAEILSAISRGIVKSEYTNPGTDGRVTIYSITERGISVLNKNK